jgi:TRAP transporter TAXI family solute receptor
LVAAPVVPSAIPDRSFRLQAEAIPDRSFRLQAEATYSFAVRYLPLAATWIAALSIAACSGGSSSTPVKQRLSIATGGTGGVFYPYGGGIAKIISEHIPGVEATAEVTAASVDNLKFLKQGTSDIAFTMADTAQDALNGKEGFEGIGAVPVRTLAVLYASYVHLVTLEGSGINRVSDLRGRTVSTGAAGSGTTVLAHRMLRAAGLDPDRDIREQSLGVAQSVDALKDGKVHAFFWNAGLPTASILDLVSTPGIRARFIATDEIVPLLHRTFGPSLYYPAVIPKGTYKTNPDVPVVAVANLLVVSESMPEALAHDITQLLFDKKTQLEAIHPQASELAIETALKGSPIPFHPGAERYYRERQVWPASASARPGSGDVSP